MPHVRLIPATVSLLTAYQGDPTELGALLESPIPDGWPEFPEAIPATIDILREHPAQQRWWMQFFLDAETGRLVGSGGYAGPPDAGCVEIGYEIAPEFRRRGFGTAAAAALVERAAESGEVSRVIAHTLAGDEASAGVLRALGFAQGEITVTSDGEIRRWERAL